MNRTDLIPATILACCVLHNMCISDEDISEAMIEEGRSNNINEEAISLQSQDIVENTSDEAGIMRRDLLIIFSCEQDNKII